MLRRLLQPVWVLLAIIFLIEAWRWDHREPIVARVVAAHSARPVQAMADGARRRAVAGDDADRLRRSDLPAVSAQADRPVAAHPRILADRAYPRSCSQSCSASASPPSCSTSRATSSWRCTGSSGSMSWSEVARQGDRAGRADQASHPRADQGQRRRPVLPHAPSDPALSQERARSAVSRSPHTVARHRPRWSDPVFRDLRRTEEPRVLAAPLRGTTAIAAPLPRADATDAAPIAPSTVMPRPASVNRPATQASGSMPVMMVAEASTMPIWNAADASSK